MASYIQIQKATKRFGTFQALKDISLDIEQGEFLAFLGPSGSGKTTLLMILAGFEAPSDGALMKGGRDISAIPADKRNFGMVFQGYALFTHMTVAENIGFALRVRGVTKSERETKIERMVEMVGLKGHAGKRTSALSGGQQQRVALARALVFEPEMLLLDEPLSALDKNLREQLQFELTEIHRRTGTTFVFVTHDQNEAMAMADRIAIFNQGEIIQVGTPRDLYTQPKTRFVAEFLGTINIFSLMRPIVEGNHVTADHSGCTLQGPLPGSFDPQRAAILAVRPEQMTLHSVRPHIEKNLIAAKLTANIYQGGSAILRAETCSGVDVTITGSVELSASAPELGTDVWLSWDTSNCLILEDT